MAEKEFIERKAAVLSLLDKGQHSRRYKLGEIWELDFEEIREAIKSIPAADVRPVVVCADCEHNKHCLTQEFVDDCGKIPLDRSSFFCADGKRADDA